MPTITSLSATSAPTVMSRTRLPWATITRSPGPASRPSTATIRPRASRLPRAPSRAGPATACARRGWRPAATPRAAPPPGRSAWSGRGDLRASWTGRVSSQRPFAAGLAAGLAALARAGRLGGRGGLARAPRRQHVEQAPVRAARPASRRSPCPWRGPACSAVVVASLSWPPASLVLVATTCSRISLLFDDAQQPLAQVVLALVTGVEHADDLVDQLVFATELVFDPRERALLQATDMRCTSPSKGGVFTPNPAGLPRPGRQVPGRRPPGR